MATHSNFLAWTIPMDRGQRKSHGQRTLRAIVQAEQEGLESFEADSLKRGVPRDVEPRVEALFD